MEFGIRNSEFGMLSGGAVQRDGAAVSSAFRIPHSAFARRGFSFTEVMFAVVILGIGFIMVAGIFPVSLQQAKQTSEEITGAAVARAGGSYMIGVGDDSILPNPNMPATGTATHKTNTEVKMLDMSAATSPWQAVAGNMVQSDDPRFAWTAMYRRDGDATNKSTWAPFAQVYVFALVSRVTDQFSAIDTERIPTVTPKYFPNFQPKPIRIAVVDDVLEAGGMDLIAIFQDGTQRKEDYTGAAVEGAYVIVQKDEIQSPVADVGRMNGRIFRLGPERLDMIDYFTTLLTKTPATVFELQPGNDFAPDAGADGVLYDPTVAGTNPYGPDDIIAIGVKSTLVSSSTLSTVDVNDFALASVVGRGYEDPSQGDSGGADDAPDFAGPSMAVGAYTTFVRIKQ